MILSTREYQPAASFGFTATAFSNLNAANLFADFQTKNATKVLVELTCLARCNSAGTLLFGLRDASGNVTGSKQSVFTTTTTDQHRILYRQPMIVVPYTNYTWFWAAAVATAFEDFSLLNPADAGDDNYFVMQVTAED